jgi:uncharacterized protein (DUF1697 family)
LAAGVQYLALLRGINVGGRNLVKMDDLRAAFEELDVADVETYIASGNVLFRAPRQKRADLAARLESALSRRFETELKVVLLTERQLRTVVDSAPRGFGRESHLADVLFVREPLTVRKVMSVVETKEGVDEVWAGTVVVYWSRLAARASSSRLAKLASRPEYKSMTARSWSTTQKLLAQVDSRAG